jgi:hypothetical protein
VKSHWISRACVFAVVAIGLVACTKTDDGFIKAFEESARVAATSGNASVTISAVTDFSWEELYVFAPYTPIQRIQMQLGFKWAEAEKTHIDSSDTFYLLVFVQHGSVVRHFKSPRRIGDFDGLEVRNRFTPGNDTFEIKSFGSNNPNRFKFTLKQEPQSGLK